MKYIVRVLLLSFAFLAGAPAFAALPDNAAEIQAHLEFVGYEVTIDKERIIGKHPNKPNIILIKHQGGLMGMTYFLVNDFGKQNREKLVTVANELNADSLSVRFYINKDGNLIIVAYYPGTYNKQSFSAYLDAYQLFRRQISEKHSELKPYWK